MTRLLCALGALLYRFMTTPVPTAWAWPETNCSEPLPGPFDSRPGGVTPVAARPGHRSP